MNGNDANRRGLERLAKRIGGRERGANESMCEREKEMRNKLGIRAMIRRKMTMDDEE